MSKTALQEFIDNVIPMHIIELHDIKKAIKKGLEKEKEQMCEFAEWYASGLTNTERWRKSIDEHYKDFLIINRKPKL